MSSPYITIAKRKIGPDYTPFVIAEVGINHEGSFKKAIKMVDDAKAAGCECVKFQSHVIDDEMIPEAKNVIPGHTKESIYEIIERCALTADEEVKLKEYVESLGMIYLCSPFSRAAANRLHKIGVKAFKIGSGECNNYPLIDHIASFGKPIILSTGMNNITSIKIAVKTIKKRNTPFALFHCTSLYPTPYDKVRLGGIAQLKKAFPDIPIGLSDHSIGNYTSFAAVALGASLIEKHFTSNKSWPGPDIAVSIDPKEMKDLIIGVDAIYKSLGGKKEILKDEKPTIDFAYACVVSIEDIKKGQKFNMKNIWVKRPGTGQIKAINFKKVLGKIALKDIQKDIQVKWSDFKK